MFFRRDHPLLRGCRIFAWPSARTQRNLVARGGTALAAESGGGLGSFLAPWPAVDRDGVDDHAAFGNMDTYGLTGRDVTVMARVAPDTAGVYGIVTCRQNTPTTTTAGFGLYFSNFGGAEDGYVFVVYGTDGGNNFQRVNDGPAGASGQLGKNKVVCGSYNNLTKVLKLYVDGRLVGQQTGGVNYDVRETVPVYIGRFNSGAYFDGKIGWAAVFDRVLSDAEVRAWARDDRWPFFTDEPPLAVTGGATYTTEVGVGQTYGPDAAGATTYATGVDLLEYLSGDMTGGEPESDTATYGTEVGINQSFVGDVPILVSYHNVVSVDSVTTQAAQVIYQTVVGVRSQERSTIDGRRDLLSTRRYRR